MMIVDRGPGRPAYEILDKVQFTSVQIPLSPEVEAAIIEIFREGSAVQDYIHACYIPLRQTGTADISGIEVPQCVLDRVSRRASPPPSESEESDSSTKRTRTRSKSQSPKGD